MALAACGREEPPKPVDPGTKVEQAAKQLGDAARHGDVHQAGEAMKQMGEALSGSVKVEPVDFRKLKELLPESIAGLKRTASEGSRTNISYIKEHGDGPWSDCGWMPPVKRGQAYF